MLLRRTQRPCTRPCRGARPASCQSGCSGTGSTGPWRQSGATSGLASSRSQSRDSKFCTKVFIINWSSDERLLSLHGSPQLIHLTIEGAQVSAYYPKGLSSKKTLVGWAAHLIKIPGRHKLTGKTLLRGVQRGHRIMGFRHLIGCCSCPA